MAGGTWAVDDMSGIREGRRGAVGELGSVG